MGHPWGVGWDFGGLESHLGGLEGHLGRFWWHHWLAGGHLADLGSHLLASRTAKGPNLDVNCFGLMFWADCNPVQVISEG